MAEQARGFDARIVDGLAIGGVIAAVDAASGEIDTDVGAFEMLGPVTKRCAVPMDGLPGRGVGAAGEYGDVMALLLEVLGEDMAELATAAGDDDAEEARIGGHAFSVSCRVMPAAARAAEAVGEGSRRSTGGGDSCGPR